MKNTKSEIVSQGEAMEMLGCKTIPTLRRHALNGTIPCHVRHSSDYAKLKFFRSKLETYLRAVYSGPDWLVLPESPVGLFDVALTKEEARNLLGYSTADTMLTHAKEGRLPCHIVHYTKTTRILFFRFELEAYLRATYSGPDWLAVA